MDSVILGICYPNFFDSIILGLTDLDDERD